MIKKVIISVIASAIVAAVAWEVVPSLTLSQIQPIASTAATVTGILFGFVMASVILLATAKDNALIRNTQLTGYLPRLVRRLHETMGCLLSVCIIFLASLFIPENAMFSDTGTLSNLKLISIIVEVGVFVLTFSVCMFIIVWREFSKFSANM
ncbi:hypothetical protein [Marinomonas sp.]|uniref:hypothetical protein n=1 Tax=Marinomonas sp. TaxID=1904862 RepID=UPI003BA95378